MAGGTSTPTEPSPLETEAFMTPQPVSHEEMQSTANSISQPITASYSTHDIHHFQMTASTNTLQM